MSADRLVPAEPLLSLGEKVVRALVVIAALGVAGAVAWRLSFLLPPIALGLLGYYCLSPLVAFLERHRVPRWAAVTSCFVVGLALLIGVGLAVWPALEGWLQQAPQGQKSAFELQLSARLDGWEHVATRAYPRIPWHHTFGHLRGLLAVESRHLIEDFPLLVSRVLSQTGTYLLAPVITLFVLLDGAEMRRRLISWVPNRHFETVLVLLHRVDRQIAAYLRGAASESAIVAIWLTFVLALAGMPHPLLFGCLYGLVNVVPLVGPLVGASAGLLYALMDPRAPGLLLLACCYAVTYAGDAAFINPLVVKKSLNLHPLAVLIGVAVGGSLGGIVGMLVCIPLIAIARAILTTVIEVYRRPAV